MHFVAQFSAPSTLLDRAAAAIAPHPAYVPGGNHLRTIFSKYQILFRITLPATAIKILVHFSASRRRS